ncbi:MAG TPA: polysaccharide deacetylase family protein [Chthoniobacteraceae bacterium]|jgi:predicted deacetylase|nr:polysaccharide deacetylase family protein [Chthoniobacteraceae bacterium]
MKTQALVVSLHDVSPHTRPACERILEELSALGIPTCSLLVIPNHHRRGHFLDDPVFCQWLKAQAQAGHEIVTHGYFHQRARRAEESTQQKLMTRVYTADEGEFYDLDGQSARDLVAKANAEFAQLGVAPRGFIAPAWLLGTEAEAVLRELKIEYTTRLGSVLDLRTNTTYRSQSLVWSVRSRWRRATSIAWNARLFRRLRSNPLLRISIHPVDVEHAAIWRQICRCITHALGTRVPVTYGRWIGSD